MPHISRHLKGSPAQVLIERSLCPGYSSTDILQDLFSDIVASKKYLHTPMVADCWALQWNFCPGLAVPSGGESGKDKSF